MIGCIKWSKITGAALQQEGSNDYCQDDSRFHSSRFYTSKLHHLPEKSGIETLLKYAYYPAGINRMLCERLLRKNYPV